MSPLPRLPHRVLSRVDHFARTAEEIASPTRETPPLDVADVCAAAEDLVAGGLVTRLADGRYLATPAGQRRYNQHLMAVAYGRA